MIKFTNPERAKKLTELAICLTVLVLIAAAFIVNSVVSRSELASSDQTESSISDDLATLIKIETQTMAEHNSAFAKLRDSKRAGSDDASADVLPKRDAEIEASAKSHKSTSKSTVGGFLRGIQQHTEHSGDVQVQDKQ